MRSRGLTDKHKKALALLQNTDVSVEDVAKESGMDRAHLYNLIAGSERAGPVSQEFTAQYQKVMQDFDKRTQSAAKALKEKCIRLLDREVDQDAKEKKLAKDTRKSLVDTVKALNSGPTYNIGSVSYARGLNTEEMQNEFRRLRGIVESALDRRPVYDPAERGAGVLSLPSGTRNQHEEGEEVTGLSTES